MSPSTTTQDYDRLQKYLSELATKLKDPSTNLSQKYRILFALKQIADPKAQLILRDGLSDPSDLLRHEIAYCLGQRQDPGAVALLAGLLKNPAEHPMVRHEAGEALGAIGTEECITHLRDHKADSCTEVAQTCQLALQRIDYLSSGAGKAVCKESRYLSVDPAPALPTAMPLLELKALLCQDSAEIFQRYQALFALRNLGDQQAVQALCASFSSNSILLKHEVAYVLGQMQSKLAVDTLRRVLEDQQENAMVRHEAAEALGAIADPGCIELLADYCRDPDPIVADSCIVALGMLDYELSGTFQYAESYSQ